MKRLATRSRLLARVLRNPRILTCDARHLFVVGHMRSRSTVLMHLLGSHEECVGYREMHASYEHRWDTWRLRIHLHREAQRDLDGCYLIDKLLHNRWQVAPEVARRLDPKWLVLIREPSASIRSMVAMGRMGNGRMPWLRDVNRVVEHYCSRLEVLERESTTPWGEVAWLEADALVHRTDEVLTNLTEWLGLRTPIRDGYARFEGTGKRGSGDPSDNIQAGQVIETARHDEIEIPESALARATVAYERCRAALQDRARTI